MIFGIFTPEIGEDFQVDIYFVRRVETTGNELVASTGASCQKH